VAKLTLYQTKLALLVTFAVVSAAQAQHCCAQEFGAQDFLWYEGFMFSAASSLFYTPKLFSEYIEPQPGIRGALGYRYGNVSLTAESGYTQVIGTNPLVLDIVIVPLVVRASYYHNLLWNFGLRADLGIGAIHSTIIHFKDAIAFLTDDLMTSRKWTPMLESRLYLTYSLPANIQLYAGGGVDILDEVDGIIPLPLIQAGITFSPFAGKRRKPTIQAPPVFQRQLVVTHFPANIAEMFESSFPFADEAGRLLQESEQTKVTLRGYAALFGTAGARSNISQARAVHIKNYLVKQYGINEDRIQIEFYGADREPEAFDGSWESYRVVELIIESNE